jgi:hypothetical protein
MFICSQPAPPLNFITVRSFPSETRPPELLSPEQLLPGDDSIFLSSLSVAGELPPIFPLFRRPGNQLAHLLRSFSKETVSHCIASCVYLWIYEL